MVPVTALVTRAERGDTAAVSALLDHCRPALVRFAAARLPSHLRSDLAEDMVQAALVVALKQLSQPPAFTWQGQPAFVSGCTSWSWARCAIGESTSLGCANTFVWRDGLPGRPPSRR